VAAKSEAMKPAELQQTLGFRHPMQYGAEVLPDGVRFRLWAPAASRVSVVLEKESAETEMRKLADGWFEVTEGKGKPGTRYRYRIDGELLVPDPASRFQPQDVDGPSEVIDPAAFRWDDGEWRGRPWREAVLYELHVGTFSPEGTYRGVLKKLSLLKELGVTAIELMPLADFAGRRNWGYDGVLPFAPDSRYGRPEDLKALVQAAHRAGMMVLLDVVYNHFGPQGNYLQRYAPQFFTERHATPWGAAIDFSQGPVRGYFVANARYWLEEFRFDGLRLDAVHAIHDDSPTHVLEEIISSVGTISSFPRHLVLENEANQARFLGPGGYRAQWNDDAHHACHVLATGETQGYYAGFAAAPARQLARCLAEGFAYQGEPSPFHGGKPRGEPSVHLPPGAFIDFLQNHDQIGNRAHGERLLSLSNEQTLRALSAILLLAPSVPLLFMGEEWGCRQPFLFFCDFGGELGEAVRKGRRSEFPHFRNFPDPLAETTFKRCVLRWKDRDGASGEAWLAHYRGLLDVRRREIAPRDWPPGRWRMLGERAFEVTWDSLALLANCSAEPLEVGGAPRGEAIWSNGSPGGPWTVNWWKSR
jgi:malto-oligosyltrehalose trehalohydrolase